MGKIIEMFLPLMLLASSYLTTVKCDKTWLTDLPDSRKLDTLAFIGTHETASYGARFEFAKRQIKGMTEQLEAGIRVFDMRVRRTNNAFAMHHGFVYLNKMFGDLVNDVRAYLEKNPKEFVIMLMQEEYEAESSSLSECQILENHYLSSWPDLFVQHWSIRDSIGQHRGKILLARSNRGFSECVTHLPCSENSGTKSNIGELQARVWSRTHDAECYINTLERGANELIVPIFKNPQNTLYIIMADYPPQILIDTVLNSHRRCTCPR